MPKNNDFRLGIVGGRLQGIETAYLAQEAGYNVTVIDRHADAPALALAHQPHVFDVCQAPDRFYRLAEPLDAILPATENAHTLDFLASFSQETGLAFLHDPAAYAVSSSKVRSNAFFAEHQIPLPAKWPACHFPVIIKPSGASGSHGVCIVSDPHRLDSAVSEIQSRYGEAVIEAFLKGPSLSLEVISRQGIGMGYVDTELEFDNRFDCKRVYAPSRLPRNLYPVLESLCLDIARNLHLTGLMDVEVIADPATGDMAVLEIDARFPSQTPIAVYHATGINLLEEWINVQVCGRQLCKPVPKPGCALLEHVAVYNGSMKVIGETRLLPLHRPRIWTSGSFFGASTAITDYEQGRPAFKATLIFSAEDWAAVETKQKECKAKMMSDLNLKKVIDTTFTIPKI